MSKGIRSAAIAEQLLSVEAAAERLDTKPRFIRRLIAERRIEFVQGRPTRPDQRIRAGRLHRGGKGSAANRRRPAAQVERSGLMANKDGHRRFGNVRKLPIGPVPDSVSRAGRANADGAGDL